LTHRAMVGSQPIERRSPSVGAETFGSHERSFEDHHRTSGESLDPANLSIGHSEVSLTGLSRSEIYQSSDEVRCLRSFTNNQILTRSVRVLLRLF